MTCKVCEDGLGDSLSKEMFDFFNRTGFFHFCRYTLQILKPKYKMLSVYIIK